MTAEDKMGSGGMSLSSLRIIALCLALLIAVADQATKWLIVQVVMQPPRVIEITGFFNLILTFNCGVSFGLFAGDCSPGDLQPFALSGLAGVITLGLLVWLWQSRHWLPAIGIGLVIGGAIGNTIDRLFLPERAVVDFLHFHGWVFDFPPLHGQWPAFNLADSAIFIGVIALLYDGLFLQPSEAKIRDSGEGSEQGET